MRRGDGASWNRYRDGGRAVCRQRCRRARSALAATSGSASIVASCRACRLAKAQSSAPVRWSRKTCRHTAWSRVIRPASFAGWSPRRYVVMVSRPRKGKIIVFGILFWYPLAGVTYQFLHYLIALRRLGYDPYYLEDSGRWIYDPRINDMSPDGSGNIAAVAPVLEAHGFAGKWAFRGAYADGRCYGMTHEQINRLYQEADAFLNVTGAQEIREEHLRCPRRIYVESDPFVSQVKVAMGDKG